MSDTASATGLPLSHLPVAGQEGAAQATAPREGLADLRREDQDRNPCDPPSAPDLDRDPREELDRSRKPRVAQLDVQDHHRKAVQAAPLKQGKVVMVLERTVIVRGPKDQRTSHSIKLAKDRSQASLDLRHAGHSVQDPLVSSLRDPKADREARKAVPAALVARKATDPQ